MSSEDARFLASRLLETSLPTRWSHVVGVASTAVDVTEELQIDADDLVEAAWLHDVGYAPSLVRTGLHALDGARYLRELGWDRGVVTLVAHHSASRVEAVERGLEAELLREFPEPTDQSALDLLWYCDMTTDPRGAPVTVEERLAEIQERYGGHSVVTKFVNRAACDLVAAVRRVEERLREVDASRGRADLGGPGSV